MFQCKCEQDYTSIASSRSNPNLTPTLFKNFLLTSLSLNDPCVPDNFSDMIETMWGIVQWQSGCDLEMQYLLTRLELIKVIMGCKVYEIDRTDSVSESNSKSDLTTKQDSQSQSQQTGHSSGYTDLIGEQRYNDLADSTLRAESQRSAYSESHDESHQRMDDDGSGESQSTTVGARESESERVAKDFSESESTSIRGGARRGFNYNHSASRTAGSGTNLGVLGIGRTATKNSWDQLMRSDTSDDGYSNRNGFSTRELDAFAKSSSTTERQSSSFFNALMDERVWGASISGAEDHQTAQSDSDSHAEGLGQSATEQEAKSQGGTQGTSQSDNVSTTERDGTRSSYTISDTVAASQRFMALRDMFDNTLSLIEYKRGLLAAQQGVGIAPIAFCLKCGYTPSLQGDPARARLCLCREPACPICAVEARKTTIQEESNDQLKCL